MDRMYEHKTQRIGSWFIDGAYESATPKAAFLLTRSTDQCIVTENEAFP